MKYLIVFTKGLAIAVICLFASQVNAQSQLIKNLKAGKKQTLVVYGTSLSAGVEGGRVWVKVVDSTLNGRFPGLLTTINSGKSGMWSTWGVQHLEDSVISKKPDAVLMEFAVNDAFVGYNTSVDLARLNLVYMIERIKLANPNCEVILQVMDIPINNHGTERPNILAYYEMYRAIAAKKGSLLIDHYPHWKRTLDQGKDTYLKFVPDGIHPNAESGRNIIAPYILTMLYGGMKQ